MTYNIADQTNIAGPSEHPQQLAACSYDNSSRAFSRFVKCNGCCDNRSLSMTQKRLPTDGLRCPRLLVHWSNVKATGAE